MKKSLLAWAFAALACFAAPAAQASVVCNSCDFIGGASVATYLGEHSTITHDNSTFSNATTGQNGDFVNWWIFKVDPAGLASVNAIFLPILNISNFDVKLFDIDAMLCAANTFNSGGACTLSTPGALVADGLTSVPFATVINLQFLDAGFYAFRISGTISGLGIEDPASYTGNLQVDPLAVPEPGALALAGLGLLGVAFTRRKKGAA
jgi:hypothetical protein